MAKTEKTLGDAFYETLKDVYWAEKHSVKACEKSAKLAKLPMLIEAFKSHAKESEVQVERLVQVFAIIDKKATAKTCEATKGILAEMTEDTEEFGDTEASDDVLIGCAQALEHYEIARYGMLASWAKRLGLKEAVSLLTKTLEEEKAADAKLTACASALPSLNKAKAA